jgi:hypothetical protein
MRVLPSKWGRLEQVDAATGHGHQQLPVTTADQMQRTLRGEIGPFDHLQFAARRPIYRAEPPLKDTL